jgi:hypothetical protein
MIMIDRAILKAVFADKVITDDRLPFLTLQLGGKTWGFFLPQITIWLQVLTVSVSTSPLIFILTEYPHVHAIPLNNQDNRNSKYIFQHHRRHCLQDLHPTA